MAKVLVIGGGFSGLSAACFLAKGGHRVTIAEKNSSLGGRARAICEQGFMFDMGPSWYWMPDIFERFFSNFGKRPSDYYQLKQLDPGFQLIFGKRDVLKIPARLDDIYGVFEEVEKGSSLQLKKFLSEGAFKYKAGMQRLVYKPSLSWLEYADRDIMRGALKMHLFQSVSDYVRGFFRDERLIALMEFPVLFLGAMANQIPALYSLMNYAALSLGTWYPQGGMIEIVDALEDLATGSGVEIITGCDVTKILINDKCVSGIKTKSSEVQADGLVATGDYQHMEQSLLDSAYRNYDSDFWNKKTFAPSCLIFYIGVNKKLNRLIHHNLFFDTSMEAHAKAIYEQPEWPASPLFYACCPSKTDKTVAPEGMENLFLLVPVAPGLADTEEIRTHYFHLIMKRLEDFCGEPVEPAIVYRKSYCINDFRNDYYAYKGNAYGLANTLRQTGVFKPSLSNRKVKNLFYAGQLTVPGPGVPPALISGQLAAEQLNKYLK